MQALVARVRGQMPANARHLLVAHAFVAGALTSDSERPLTVGGTGQVPAALFDGFDYVALGHLHRPQTAGAPGIRYAGSLLKYSFEEAGHAKSVTIVEIDPSRPKVAPTVQEVALTPRRDVRVIEGDLREVIKGAAADTARDDYVCARLLDRGALLDPIGQLREVYPNVLAIERGGLDLADDRGLIAVDPRSTSESEHFAAFFSYCTDDDLSAPERAAFAAVVDDLERAERRS